MIDSGRGQRFRPEDRMRRKVDFDRAYAAGKRVTSKSFTLIAHDAGQAHPRLGVTVSRKVGSAVVRNAVRRRIREAFRRNREALPGAIDIVIHVRPRVARASFAALEAEFREAIRRYGEARGPGR